MMRRCDKDGDARTTMVPSLFLFILLFVILCKNASGDAKFYEQREVKGESDGGVENGRKEGTVHAVGTEWEAVWDGRGGGQLNTPQHAMSSITVFLSGTQPDVV
jgi:hypothetical protein